MTESCAAQLWSDPLDNGAADSQVPRPAVGQGQDPEEVFAKLYADNKPFILSYVTGLLNDRYLAEDVVQEAMLRAWHYYGQFSAEKGSARGWLIRVAHNIAVDKIRMRRSRPAEVAEDAVPDALVVEDHADAILTVLQVRHALALLSPGHRQILEEVYLHGHTAREAAARLGIPVGTAFSRAYYALRILRRELGAAPEHAPHRAA